MTDKILAGAALIGLVLFLMVLPLFVPRPALILLTLFCVILATFDFWRELFRGGGGNGD